MRLTRARAVVLAALAAVIAAPTAAHAHTVNDNLPGGTSIGASIDTPADGAVLPAGPVTVTGTASIGEGAPVANTAIAYVLDVSGSTVTEVPGGCGGGGAGDDILDCQIAAARNLNGTAIAAQTVGAVGAAVFADTGVAADVTPGGGDDLITGPATDANGAGGPDIEEVLASAVNAPSGGIGQFTARPSVGLTTSFAAGITSATAIATDAANTMDRTIVAFMSDGFPNPGDAVPAALAAVPPDVDVFTFAVGAGSTCGLASDDTSLEHIAQATGGVCVLVPDVTMLPDFLPAVIAAELATLTLTVDGGAGIPITDVTPALPQEGPAAVTYSVGAGALAVGTHELCVTAGGSDAGGTGSATECHDVTINAPPQVDPGGPYAGPEGAAVAIAGTVDDPDSPGVTSSWAITPVSGVDPGADCEFGDGTAVATTVECTDDGEFELTLTADDGVNPPVAASVTLVVSNVAPAVDISAPDDGVLVAAGTPVDVAASFTDAGANDTHDCTVDFDDGTAPADGTVDQEPGSGTCTTTHAITALGPHNVLVTVTDDDGAQATDVVTVVVYLPGEAFSLQAIGPLTIPKTTHVACPPDDSRFQAQLNAAIATVSALTSQCTVDPDTGETTASAAVDGASLLAGLITISNIESTCVANAGGISRTSNVGTINGTPIGQAAGSITIPLVARVFFNENTTGPGGQLGRNAVRVQTPLGQQIILGSCRLG